MAERILVVDDDVESLKLIGMMLQRQGYEVILASNGQQALDRALADRPDLIILDVMMPVMDGYEVCRRLRQDPITQNIPILMFTAKTMVDDKVAGFEAGADDYLTKPTHPAELASRVKALLARRPAQPAQAPVMANRSLVWGFLGAKGGVGTTTVAANCAAALVKYDTTILADFRLGQGSLALSLGLMRATGMANLLARPTPEITVRAVEGELVTHASGLRLLLSSSRPKETLLNAAPDGAAAIVRHLQAIHPQVVLDLGSGLNRLTARLVLELDRLTLVVEPNRVALILARDVLAELQQIGVQATRLSVVLVNRTQSSLHVPWQEAEHMLGHEIAAIISPAPELLFQAAEAGLPVVLYQPNSIVGTQFAKLTEEVVARR